MTGVAPLREAIADKTAELYGWQPDATAEVTVTAGATEALFAAISALVRPATKWSASIPATTAMRRRSRWPAAYSNASPCSRPRLPWIGQVRRRAVAAHPR